MLTRLDLRGVADVATRLPRPGAESDEPVAAVRSILHQTNPCWELLLCDDGSSDRSLAVAESFEDEREREAELERLIAGARQARALGLKVNAGHGLNYQNLPVLHRVPHLVELNIGHSIISRAITVGLATAVSEMLKLMEHYR